jgi:hypothetical protein
VSCSTQITQHLNNYTQTSRDGFEGMVKLSNEQFDTAVQRLGASIEDLPEYLDDLNDLIGNLTPRLRA